MEQLRAVLFGKKRNINLASVEDALTVVRSTVLL
jgi:hypothetical protein